MQVTGGICIDVRILMRRVCGGVSRKVLDKLYAESVQSASYPVLIENELWQIWAAALGMFDGENACKGISH